MRYNAARTYCADELDRIEGGHTKAASYRTFTPHAHAYGVTEAVKIAHLELANINATHAFAKEHGIVCESRPCPTVDIIYDAETYASGVSAIECMKQSMESGDPASEYDIFGPEEAKKEFLVDSDDVKGAFRYAAGSISAYKFTTGVLKLCLSRGLNLQTNTPVTSIEKGEAEVWTVVTARGTVTTKNLILATNGYTAHLLPQMQTKIVSLRGQVTAHRPGPKLKALHPNGLPQTYSFMYSNGYEYMIPRPRLASVPDDFVGDIVIGGAVGALPNDGRSEFGETDDTAINELSSKYLHASTKRYFGKNWGEDDPEQRVRKEWSGIMGITGDGLPYVGRFPEEEGLWISAGINGHGKHCVVVPSMLRTDENKGMVLCLKSAEALTHMLCGDENESYEWFPSSFVITEKRLRETMFEGRKAMKAPPELAGAEFKQKISGTTYSG